MQDFILLENPAHNAMLCTVKHTDYWSGFGSKDRATNDPIYLNSYQLSKFGRGYMKIGNKRVTKTWILKSLSSNDFSKCLIFSIDVPLVNSKEITKSRMGFLLRKGKNFFLKQTNRFFCFFNNRKIASNFTVEMKNRERYLCACLQQNSNQSITRHKWSYTLIYIKDKANMPKNHSPDIICKNKAFMATKMTHTEKKKKAKGE